MKIGSTDPDTTLHKRKKTLMKNYSFFFLRLDLAEISAKTLIKHQLVHTKFLEISSFPIKVEFGGDNAQDTRKISISISLPNSPPTKRYYLKHDSLYMSSNYKKTVYLRCPAQFCTFLHFFGLKFSPYV